MVLFLILLLFTRVILTMIIVSRRCSKVTIEVLGGSIAALNRRGVALSAYSHISRSPGTVELELGCQVGNLEPKVFMTDNLTIKTLTIKTTVYFLFEVEGILIKTFDRFL